MVESHAKGGALITAGIADSYNRTVMALPGRPTDSHSAGCNALIRRNAAHLVCTADDIIEVMGWEPTGCPTAIGGNDGGDGGGSDDGMAEYLSKMSADERRIAAVLCGGEALAPDTLSVRAGMDIGTVLSTLMIMELGGSVHALPGNLYELQRK